ncbi:phage portal protein [Priestia flexa]|uniref:phage portal protein n=1 Tax=Priestia flexa TaxID=86664 RepID=UPI00204040B8|nr:phage portal protein [Priestia flexa]MCM3068061.1 phage portal protein [Priestia flexa]
MSWLGSIFQRNRDLPSSFSTEDEIFGFEVEQRAYLKQLAIEICINFIARTVAQSDFRIMQNKNRIRDNWDYLLNVRPNTDSSASDFWQDAIYKLIHEQEVLIILNDSGDLLIADSFIREERAVYPDTFKNVTVKEFTFMRSFSMEEVIYLTYNNEKLSRFMNGMFEDFTQLFSRMVESSMFANQVRATAGIESTQKLDEESLGKLQNFIDRMFKSFRKNAFAIVPKLKGFEYDEITDGSNGGRSIDEITKVLDKAIEYVAELLGIPPVIVQGSLSDYETALKSYIKFTYNPLLKKISDELNAKLLDKKEYQLGKRIEIVGIQVKSVTENAEAVDKLVASGAYTRNEVREKFGDERVDDPELDKYVITKNYQTVEGGETNESKTTV